MANPRNIRQAMNGMDPRQRGLLAAAWSLGFVARFAKGGASAVTLGGGVGEFGIAYAKMDYPQPWFDDHGGVYPVYHVFKGLAELRGQPLLNVVISRPREIQAIAAARDGGVEIWIANLTSRMNTVELPTRFTGRAAVLTALAFEQASSDFSAPNFLEHEFTDNKLILAPYAVARLRGRPH